MPTGSRFFLLKQQEFMESLSMKWQSQIAYSHVGVTSFVFSSISLLKIIPKFKMFIFQNLGKFAWCLIFKY